MNDIQLMITLGVMVTGAGAVGGLVAYWFHRLQLGNQIDDAIATVDEYFEDRNNDWLEYYDRCVVYTVQSELAAAKAAPKKVTRTKGSPLTREQAKEAAKKAK